MLCELRENNLFDDLTRNVIINKMNQIKVKFQFWKEKGSESWNYMSLMGKDKLNMLKNFNLELLFLTSR